jgi:hypothetical protein
MQHLSNPYQVSNKVHGFSNQLERIRNSSSTLHWAFTLHLL